MIALFCKVNAVQAIWPTYGHMFALLLNTLLIMCISVFSEYIWDRLSN